MKNIDNDEIVEDQCDVLVSASGALNEWKWPTIPGLHDFKGKLMHSAKWDESYDYSVSCSRDRKITRITHTLIVWTGQKGCCHRERIQWNPDRPGDAAKGDTPGPLYQRPHLARPHICA